LETAYVLDLFDEIDQSRISEVVRSSLAMESGNVVDEHPILRSIEINDDDRLDFAEAFLVPSAESTSIVKIALFDRSIDRVRSIARIQPERLNLSSTTCQWLVVHVVVSSTAFGGDKGAGGSPAGGGTGSLVSR
jgi:hypothetical protein